MCESKEKHRDFIFNHETYTREINLIFLEKDIAIEFTQGEKQQGLGLLYKAFVKCTNQGKNCEALIHVVK